MLMRVFAGVAIVAAFWGTQTAWADTALDDVVAGIVAQRDAAVVRERRQSDDREDDRLRELDEKEALVKRLSVEMRQLISASVAAQKETSAERTRRLDLEVQLSAARHAFEAKAAELAQQDSTWAAEREAYRSEAQQVTSQATPAKLDALQRFADGDRVDAYPIIQQLTEVSVKARVKAASLRAAPEIRQLAQLRTTMLDNGEATSADTLAVWKQAGSLDPNDFMTEIAISDLAMLVGDAKGAVVAAKAALALAKSPREQLLADLDLQRAYGLDSDPANKSTTLEVALALARKAVQSAPTDAVAVNDLLVTLSAAIPFKAQSNVELAKQLLDERMKITKDLTDNGPKTWQTVFEAQMAASDAAEMEARLGHPDLAAKTFGYVIFVSRGYLKEHPTATFQKKTLSRALNGLSSALIVQGNLADALVAGQEAVEVDRAMAAQDPSDASVQAELALSTISIAINIHQQGDLNGSINLAKDALNILKSLHDKLPDNVEFGIYYMHGLTIVGDFQDQIQAATANYQLAVDVGRGLLATSPDSDALKTQEAKDIGHLAAKLAESGQQDAALVQYAAEVQLYRELARASPKHFDAQLQLDRALAKYEKALNAADQDAAAGDVDAEMVSVRRNMVSIEPQNLEAKRALWAALLELAALKALDDKWDVAIVNYKEVVTIARALQVAGLPSGDMDLQVSLDGLASARAAMGDSAAALAAYREALPLARKNAGLPTATDRDRRQLISDLENIVDVAKPKEALAAAEEAVVAARKLVDGDPTNLRALPVLLRALNVLGGAREISADRPGAIATYNEVLSIAGGKTPDEQRKAHIDRLVARARQNMDKLNTVKKS